MAHILGDKDDQTVSCGIAVAPVTDFRYYGQSVTCHRYHAATSTQLLRSVLPTDLY